MQCTVDIYFQIIRIIFYSLGIQNDRRRILSRSTCNCVCCLWALSSIVSRRIGEKSIYCSFATEYGPYISCVNLDATASGEGRGRRWDSTRNHFYLRSDSNSINNIGCASCCRVFSSSFFRFDPETNEIIIETQNKANPLQFGEWIHGGCIHCLCHCRCKCLLCISVVFLNLLLQHGVDLLH